MRMKSFNDTIFYLESVLEDTLDEAKVQSVSGYSYAMFCSLFSILTGMTLWEYLRGRKLTKHFHP